MAPFVLISEVSLPCRSGDVAVSGALYVSVNGGAKRDHRGGVRRDHLAAAGLSPSPWEGPGCDAACPQQADAAGARGRDLWAHGVKRGLGGRFSSPSGFDACGSG